ncbi:ABC transporter substrate-binding protein [Pseudonocardia sp. HH130629-09]|uniref:ABC transporter substrate-binding protein n=1 Tax=Pseudonocardia sp. HH130629-09 TaxID=1641402 RepID=UPI000761811C|nr:ABC transporter substrate-binding protein [Pseudonocardia sp. HH130629-09]
MTRTTTRLAAVLLAACLVLAGCGSGGGQDGRDRITFLNILPMESLGYAAEMVADTKGFFAANGLDVTFEATQGSAPAIQTLLAGSAEISRIGDIETMVAAGERGAPLVAIGGVVHDGALRLVSSRRAPITDAAGRGPTGIDPQRWQATYDEVSSVGQAPAGQDPAQWLDAGLDGTEGSR